jgi:uncharacterized repeat protein (TIGR02543 family)
MKTLFRQIPAFFGIILLASIMIFSLASCQNETEDNPPVIIGSLPVTYTYNVEQVGGIDNTATTTALKFTFSGSVDAFMLHKNSFTIVEGDITISSDNNALSGTGTTRTLLINVNSPGLVTINIRGAFIPATASGIENVNKDVTVYKQGTPAPEYWTVNWVLNGGSAGTVAKYPTRVVKNTALAQPTPDPTKIESPNIFSGWYTDSGFTQLHLFSNPVTTNLTLYAKWATGSQPPTDITVPGSTLAAKLQWIKNNAQNNITYTVVVDADEEIAPQTLSYDNKFITIHLSGNESEKTVSLSQNGSLFSVQPGVTLVLDNNITLQGHDNNNSALVAVSSANLIMNNGSKITGNSNTAASVQDIFYGGGVHLRGSLSSFTMNGGEISNNYGSGVYLRSSNESKFPNSFTMNGGKISNNTNGGVYIYYQGDYYYGTFTMNDGEISYNSASDGGGVNGRITMTGGIISNNTASKSDTGLYGNGGGIYGSITMTGGTISGNTAAANGGGVYGSLTMTGGTISGNTASTSGGGFYCDDVMNKSGGTIYGYNSNDTTNSNVVKDSSGNVLNNKGHALYFGRISTPEYRDTTGGPDDNLVITWGPTTIEGNWQD